MQCVVQNLFMQYSVIMLKVVAVLLG